MLIAITVPINVYATGTEELDGNGISEKILSDENKVSVIQEDRIGGSLNIDEEKQRPIKETEVELSVDVEYSTDNNDNNEKQNEEGNYEAIDKQNVADKQNVVEDLPDSDEEQVLHQILESRISEENMIEGFNYGCDDYISKPFSLEILGQRIKAVLRRGSVQQENNQCFSYKGLSVDFKKMSVTENGIPVKLSSTEFKLLSCLIENKGQVLTRTTLLEKIWDCDANFVDENTLAVNIRRLREKIEKSY